VASEALLSRPAWTLALFDAVDSGRLPASSLAPAQLQIVAQSKHDEVKTRARAHLESVHLGRREDVVARYQSALKLDGDIERGRAVFTKQCSVCHKVEGVGHEIGPNLATIKTRGSETILVNVLDPNREVNPQYLNYIALTLDGRSISGMIAAENASSLTLQRAQNEFDTVLRVDLDRLQSTGLSIMPEGMEETIDPQSMADIIAYLMQVQ
jgi:putative heme-binding domain-containing protein